MILNSGIFLIALLHLWFFILEVFLWQKPLGLKIFKLDQAFAKRSAPLAANQGLYNLFLTAGLLWSLVANPLEGLHLKFFFLTCVLLAGIFGGFTVSVRIFIIQALPAAFILALLSLSMT
ncbi:MAG: DUF1304 domain-containing protein [Gammaproteobacteria bacterium]|nr:DUF1304 domain-containing protein [Gammaproteobacteria bacterium]